MEGEKVKLKKKWTRRQFGGMIKSTVMTMTRGEIEEVLQRMSEVGGYVDSRPSCNSCNIWESLEDPHLTKEDRKREEEEIRKYCKNCNPK